MSVLWWISSGVVPRLLRAVSCIMSQRGVFRSIMYVIGYEAAQVWVLGVPPAPRKWLYASDARFGQICGVVAWELL